MTVVHLHPRGQPRGTSPEKTRILAALDIGSTKISCLIAQAIPPKHKLAGVDRLPALSVLGVGHHAATGVRHGVVTDIDLAEKAIRLAVSSAERMAQTTISDVIVNVSGGRPQSVLLSGSMAVDGGEVSQGHMDAAIADALGRGQFGRRTLLHVAPASFDLDDAKGVVSPLGMAGERLSCLVNVVSCERPALRNLALGIERCHLSVSDFVIAPYAAARAVLDQDEMQLGTAVIDLGGQTTGIAVYHGGNLIFADVIPVGGQHITQDIAQGLSTSIAHAERMKTLWGSALASLADERDMLAVPLLGERGVDAVQKVPKSVLSAIIRPRVEEILEMVGQRIAACEPARAAAVRAVLTGGGCQLVGIRDLAAHILGYPVRLGSPQKLANASESVGSPGFSVCAGLLNYGLRPDRHYNLPEGVRTPDMASAGYMRRVGRWIAESF